MSVKNSSVMSEEGLSYIINGSARVQPEARPPVPDRPLPSSFFFKIVLL